MEARVTGAGEGGVGGPAHLVDTVGVGTTVGGGGRGVGGALVDIPAPPVGSLPHTPVGSQTIIVGLAPVLVVAASRLNIFKFSWRGGGGGICKIE